MTSNELRASIRNRSLNFAKQRSLAIDETRRSALIFSSLENCFHPESYREIIQKPNWKDRIHKPHPKVEGICEMQSSNSSDALLMNLFCHPSACDSAALTRLLRSSLVPIEFGVRANVLKESGVADSTEIDMEIPGVYCEAKLTEVDFTSQSPSIVESYDAFEAAFRKEELPRTGDSYCGYQVIRNLLAAKQKGVRHILFCDRRREDLKESYSRVVSCLRSETDRLKCEVVYWQDVVALLDKSIQTWIAERYGIE